MAFLHRFQEFPPRILARHLFMPQPLTGHARRTPEPPQSQVQVRPSPQLPLPRSAGGFRVLGPEEAKWPG